MHPEIPDVRFSLATCTVRIYRSANSCLKRSCEIVGRKTAIACLAGILAMPAVWYASQYVIDRVTKPHSQTNVVLFLLDACRADHLGCYGYGRNTSPRIDDMAQRSTVYMNHRNHSSLTPSSMSAFFTSSMLPAVCYVPQRKDTLAEVLQEHGYYTVCVQSNPWLGPKAGFNRGFDEYIVLQTNAKEEDANPVNKVLASETYAETIRAIATLQQPFLLYVHFMSPHNDYIPEERFDLFSDSQTTREEKTLTSRHFIEAAKAKDIDTAMKLRDKAVALYDAEIRQVDYYVGEIIGALETAVGKDKTIYVLKSDHGEGFLEHGRVTHSNGLNGELVNTPLIIRRPRQETQLKYTDISSDVDVVPTLLTDLGFNRRWLSKYTFKGRPLQQRRATGENTLARGFFTTRSFAYSFVEDQETGYKLIVEAARSPDPVDPRSGLRVLLYNVWRDPKETADLAAVAPDIVKSMLKEAVTIRKVKYDAHEQELRDSMSMEEKGKLKALGYLQ